MPAQTFKGGQGRKPTVWSPTNKKTPPDHTMPANRNTNNLWISRTAFLYRLSKTNCLLTCVDEPDDLRGYRLKRWVQRCCRSKRISCWETPQPIEPPRDNLLQRQSFQPFGGADCAFHTIEWLWCLSVEARSKSRHQEIWWCRTPFLIRSSHILLQVHWWEGTRL